MNAGTTFVVVVVLALTVSTGEAAKGLDVSLQNCGRAGVLL